MRMTTWRWTVVAIATAMLMGPALPATAGSGSPNPSPANPPPSTRVPVGPGSVPAKGIKAVVVKSWGGCGSNATWQRLNDNWSSYGSVPITIDDNDRRLCGGSFTLAGLEASNADVVILSDPAGEGLQYTDDEVTALKTYADEGHDLIGTYLTFYWDFGGSPVDNTALAPLFGMVQDDGWTGGENDISPNYTLRLHKLLAKRLIRDLPDPYFSQGYEASQVPGDGRWGPNDLAGATVVGVNHERSAAITVYRAKVYRAIYIANMPEFGSGTADLQFLYNAIIYPKIG